MAANYNTSDETERITHHSDSGHTFGLVFSVKYLSAKTKWTFEEEIKTGCQAMPTLWLCEMVFQKVLDDGRACILFSLKRRDYSPKPVRVRISLCIKDSTDKYLFNSPQFERQRLCAGEVIKEYLAQNLPFEEMRSYYNLRINVVALIEIIGCHSTTGKINSETFRQLRMLYDRM